MPEKELRVSVCINWPEGEEVAYTYTMPRMEYEDSLAPLPKHRFIDPLDHMRAQEMLRLRENTIDFISKSIANSLFHACAKREKGK